MARKSRGAADRRLVAETARIICEEAIVDYRLAKQKAAARLGLPTRGTALPNNLEVRDAVVAYQRIYGGTAYEDRLQRLRLAATKGMRLLAEFDPRLVGPVISGAVTMAHHVQLQAYASTAERVDVFLHDQGIACEADDRDYRFADGQIRRIPLVRFAWEDVDIDVAVFDPDQRSRPPLSPVDGRPERGLNIDQALALLNLRTGMPRTHAPSVGPATRGERSIPARGAP